MYIEKGELDYEKKSDNFLIIGGRVDGLVFITFCRTGGLVMDKKMVAQELVRMAKELTRGEVADSFKTASNPKSEIKDGAKKISKGLVDIMKRALGMIEDGSEVSKLAQKIMKENPDFKGGEEEEVMDAIWTEYFGNLEGPINALINAVDKKHNKIFGMEMF